MTQAVLSAPLLPAHLPPLRDDLQLRASATNPDGSPSWTIQDPVNNVFYKIGWLEFEFLSRWHLGSAQAVLDATAEQTLLQPTPQELLALLGFLQGHQLLLLRSPGFTEQLIERYRRSRVSRLQWLLHHYLFFRIPLWHPQAWLGQVGPLLGWIYSRKTAYALGAIALTGLALVARQYDSFASSLVDTLSPGGFAGYVLALTVTKSLHELGHAFTATRYGVRVAHMGLAFLVLWPVLYTDTSESWKLQDRRQRLAISSAGILTEMAVAAITTLAWALTEPGDVRQALFFMATTSWLLSLALNASPFMRFDGYFILSDWLDFQNLHERSSALARTWLRRHLLGWQDAYPEHFPTRQRRWLIAFALVTWVYRLTVFLAIALAVYLMFFKLLGILLFVVEVMWFVVRPFATEFRVWRARAADIAPLRRRLAWVGAGAALLLALLPWNTAVSAPAMGHSDSAHVLYSPVAGQLLAIHAKPGPVAQDTLLLELVQPEGGLRSSVAQVGELALDQQLVGLAAAPQGEEKRAALEQQRAVKQAQRHAEAQEASRLQLRAPISGVLTDVDPELAPGVWVSPRQALAVVVDPTQWTVEAFVNQHDLSRLRVGNRARFYPQDHPLASLSGTVVDMDRSRLAALPHALLSVHFGGQIPVLADSAGLTPRDVLYRVRIRLDTVPEGLAVRRGAVHIDASAQGWLFETLVSGLAVLVREASF